MAIKRHKPEDIVTKMNQILPYENTSMCPKGADVRHIRITVKSHLLAGSYGKCGLT
jgi:hypothetical protein